MASAQQQALELVKKEASMRIANAGRRVKTQSMERMIIRKAGVLGTASVYGAMNRMGVPHELAGFPWKVAVGTIATVGEALSGGKTQAVCAGIADATTAIYIERSISTGTVIAGNGGGGGGEEEVVYVDEAGNQVEGPGEDPVDGGAI